MPKETIHDVIGSFDVRVGWSADRDVQVGVETAEGHALVSRLYGDEETLAAIGRQLAMDYKFEVGVGMEAVVGRHILDVIEGVAISPTGSYTGVWSTLDRAGCNRLIKTVRRARDAAFGRDE